MYEKLKITIMTLLLEGFSFTSQHLTQQLPTPEQVQTFVDIVAQITIMIIGLWKFIKKPKKND